MKPPVHTAEVIRYFTSSHWLFVHLWSPRAYGMHVGFWDESTKSVDDAVINENASVFDMAGITDTSYVLDAGCGIGSMSFFIGNHSNARVRGITIVPQQVSFATKLSKKLHLHPRVSFACADFTDIPYPDNTFDAIIGIESICYAYPKEAFLLEARRVLKPGGRLVIADGYMAHPPKTAQERRLHDDFCEAFALSELIDVAGMERAIKKSGFLRIHRIDKTKDVQRGTAVLFQKTRFLQRFFIPFASRLPFDWARALVRNTDAARAGLGLLSSRSGWYGIFTAEK